MSVRFWPRISFVARHLGSDVMSTVLKIHNMTLGHPGLILFRKLSLDFNAGEALAVLGANGAGKTTFVKALLGLTAPKSGTLTWPAGRPRDIGYLAQSTGFDSCFPLRVRDLASMGAWKGLGLWDGLDADAKARVECALDDVGVADLADRPIHTLSGGQLQRTLFARVILQDAPLILLDEPFAAVDQSTEAHLLLMIERWRADGRAVVLVVHDLSSALDHCSHALLLGAQQATHGTVDEVLTKERLVAQGYLSESQATWIYRAASGDTDAAHV